TGRPGPGMLGRIAARPQLAICGMAREPDVTAPMDMPARHDRGEPDRGAAMSTSERAPDATTTDATEPGRRRPAEGAATSSRPSPLQSGTAVRDSLTTTSPTPNPGGDLAPGGPADSRTPPVSEEA